MKKENPENRGGKRQVPKFQSLREESDFWDAHSVLDFAGWKVVPYEEVCAGLDSREPKMPVTFRLERTLVRRLKTVARRNGLKYQALAREILRQSLAKKAQ